MKSRSILFAFTISATVALALACGSGGGGSGSASTAGTNGSASSGTTSSKKILASNIIFGASTTRAKELLALEEAGVDTTTKIVAANVVIDTSKTEVTSTNLQTALESELAPNLDLLLPGTAWTVENVNVNYSGAVSGAAAITFAASGNTFTLDSGTLGIIATNSKASDPTVSYVEGSVRYRMITRGMMFCEFEYTGTNNGGKVFTLNSVVSVAFSSKDKLVLCAIGGSRSGVNGQISVLRKK